MNVPSYEALLDKETRIKVIRELCENVNKALNSQMSVAEATGTSVEAEVGKYYRYADPVTSLVVTLPQVSGTSQPSNISFFLTTGSDPDIKFESDADVYLSGESTFSDDTSYYITATYDGAEWVVNVSVATFQSQDYFTIEALESGDITFTIGQSVNTSTLQSLSYSTDNGTNWTTITNTDGKSTALVTTISVNSGDKVLWKGVNNGISVEPQGDPISYISSFSSQISTNVYGNIMSLIYGDNFSEQTSLEEKSYCFSALFGNYRTSTYLNVINAENLSLPATTLAQGCYGYMFKGCTSLTTAPELPATTLTNACYSYMFNGCTSLTTVPVLPATTLANYCYGSMFSGCTSLTTAPELPATTLTDYCYSNMFIGCTSLNYIKAMFTTTPSATYTQNWVKNVAATGTFVKNAAAEWDVSGVNGIPSGWTVETASA